MYVGAFGILLGAGLALRSPSIIGLAVLFLLLTHFLVVLYEEPSLWRAVSPLQVVGAPVASAIPPPPPQSRAGCRPVSQ
jgi:protein-S-isoprenylcysteine O-methyltransferase Ste14